MSNKSNSIIVPMVTLENNTVQTFLLEYIELNDVNIQKLREIANEVHLNVNAVYGHYHRILSQNKAVLEKIKAKMDSVCNFN